MRWILIAITVSTFSFFASVTPLTAQESDEPEKVTIVHYPASGTTDGIAKHLGRLLGSEVMTVELPEQNAVLITVPIGLQDKVTKLIQAVDKPRAMIRYRLIWLNSKVAFNPNQIQSLSGKATEVNQAIDQLTKDGLVSGLSIYETRSLSNTECVLTRSNRDTIETARMQLPGRQQTVSRTEFRETGTTIRVNGLATKSHILVQIEANDSAPNPSTKSGRPDDKATDNGEQSVTLQTTIQIGDGDAMVISAMTHRAKDDSHSEYLILSASTE